MLTQGEISLAIMSTLTETQYDTYISASHPVVFNVRALNSSGPVPHRASLLCVLLASLMSSPGENLPLSLARPNNE
jgi:hypothetical protein